MMLDFKDKKGLILGVGNQRSIAWTIAECFHQQGATIGLNYLPDPKGRYEGYVRELAEAINCNFVMPCDVKKQTEIDALFAAVEEQWGGLDFLIHSLAYADQKDLGGAFSNTSREGFLLAQEISAYSLIALSAKALPLMKKRGGGAILTMTYIGSVLAVPSYNVMGPAKAALEANVRYLAREMGVDNIRVNAVSAGPIRTLSSAGIKGFTDMMSQVGDHSALKRAVTRKEVADTAAFLCSAEGTGITGQVVYVDCGYNMMAN